MPYTIALAQDFEVLVSASDRRGRYSDRDGKEDGDPTVELVVRAVPTRQFSRANEDRERRTIRRRFQEAPARAARWSVKLERPFTHYSVLCAMFVGDLRDDRIGGFLVTLADRLLGAVDDPGVGLVGDDQRQHLRVLREGFLAQHAPVAPLEVYEVCLSQAGDELLSSTGVSYGMGNAPVGSWRWDIIGTSGLA
jgi:hypothetical protein